MQDDKALIRESIEVDVPVSTAYNQWTQFETFPVFMEGVEQVQQVDDRRLHWQVEIGGRRLDWEAEIINQEPDRRIAWKSLQGSRNAGTVTFKPLSERRCSITLELVYEPQGLIEYLGDLLGVVRRRARIDLEHFKCFIETQRTETGAWRGRITFRPRIGRETPDLR